MGTCSLCCCCTYTKSAETKSSQYTSSTEDVNSNITTIEPMLKVLNEESETSSLSSDEFEENTDEEYEHISEMPLCEENTTELCPIALRIIHILSLYHSYVHNYSSHDSKSSNNICDVISDKMNDYDLLNLRDDSFHLITYHDSNEPFMQLLYNQIIQINENNGINIYDINNKLDIDQNNKYYFGHTLNDELSVIQCLNQIHHDCTYNYTKNKFKSEKHCLKSESVSKNVFGSQRPESVNKKMLKYKRRPDTKFKTENVNVTVKNGNFSANRIDISYNKFEKEQRKIGKLKLRKRTEKERFEKYKSGPQKILEDNSWMKMECANERRHFHSDSIKLLGNTKLVSNHQWRRGLEVLNEESNSFDLTSLDIHTYSSQENYDSSERQI